MSVKEYGCKVGSYSGNSARMLSIFSTKKVFIIVARENEQVYSAKTCCFFQPRSESIILKKFFLSPLQSFILF